MSCGDKSSSTPLVNHTYRLNFIKSYILNIAEPSGLSWALNGKDLYVVDDRLNKVYTIDKQGNTLSTFSYIGNDLEGVSINIKSQTIWLAEEAKFTVVELDSLGNEIQRFKLDTVRNAKKKGLEGISYDSLEDTFYLLNEDNPGLLIKWQVNSGVIAQTRLSFAEDYSGIFFDESDRSLWIISDQSKRLFHCDLEGNVKQSFNLPINKAEGVVVDHDNNRVYIVSDQERKLFVFSLN